MHVVARGTVIRSREGTDLQSCAFPQIAVLPGGRWIVGCRAAGSKAGREGSTFSSVSPTTRAGAGARGKPRSPPLWWKRDPPASRVRADRPGGQPRARHAVLGGQLGSRAAVLQREDPRTPGLAHPLCGVQGPGESWSAPALMDTTPFASHTHHRSDASLP